MSCARSARRDARLMIYTARRMSGAELYRMNVASVCVPRERVVAEAQRDRQDDRGEGAARGRRGQALVRP